MQNYNSRSPKKRKVRRHRSFGTVMLTIILCAVVCLIGIFAAIYFGSGERRRRAL